MSAHKKAIRILVLVGFALQARGGFAAIDPLSNAEDLRDVSSPVLAQAAHSRESRIRARAAQAYGRIQDPKAIDTLLPLLSDGSAKVRSATAFALGQLGWDSAFAGGREDEMVGKLASLLGDRHEGVRVAAIEAIGKLALEKTPSIVSNSLSDPSTAVRAESLMALYRYHLVLKSKHPEVTPADLPTQILNQVLSLSWDRHSQVRRNVAYYFSRVKDPRASRVIQEMAWDRDVWVRFFAIGALGKISDPLTAVVLVARLTDTAYVNRVAAVQALTQMNRSDLIPRALASDPSIHVRAAVADAGVFLEPLLHDSSHMVQGEALKSLSKVKHEAATPELKAALSQSDWTLREAAVEAAASSGADQESLLKTAILDGDVRVRAAAVSGMGAVPTADAFQAIQSALTSKELAERGSAVDALSARKEPSVPDVAWQAYLGSSGLEWTELRESLVDLVSQTPGDQTTAELREALKDPASSVSNIARNALLARGVTDLPPAQAAQLTFSPYRDLTFKHNPKVVLETTRGRIVIECYPMSAPIQVANFVGFARDGKYDGLTWHRVVSNFVIQGGDPDGTGWGDAGYSVRAEINPIRYQRGTLGMPRAQGFDTGGVQIFITHVPTPNLDGQYTVFGQVKQGLGVVDRIEMGDRIIKAWVR